MLTCHQYYNCSSLKRKVYIGMFAQACPPNALHSSSIIIIAYNSNVTSSPGSLLPPEMHSFPVGGGVWGRG